MTKGLPLRARVVLGRTASNGVRSWVSWHHHVTLSLLALRFAILEKRRLGTKASGNGAADA